MAEIKEIPLTQIQTPNVDYSNLEAKKRQEALVSSIKEKGLLHPISVYCVDSNEGYGIIAGKDRFNACAELKHETIKCLVFEDADEDARDEIHIHENLARFNIPWYDQVELELKLHNLRQKVHGRGRQGVKSGWSLRDTARELGMGFGNLSEDIKMAEAVMADPKLRQIKDKQTAKRLIFQSMKQVRSEYEAGLETKIDYNQVYCGDSCDILPHYPSGVFDACITDPPWARYYRDDKLISDDSTLQVFKEVFRVLKYDSFLYMFVSTADFVMYQTELPKFGFKCQEMPLIWVKTGHLTRGKRNWEYARDHEPILLAVKGAPALTSSMLSSVFTHAIVSPVKMIHPNEKPVPLIQNIVEHCTYEGSIILDPFGGSGVVASVAKSMSRRYVTIERDKNYFDGIESRLKSSGVRG